MQLQCNWWPCPMHLLSTVISAPAGGYDSQPCVGSVDVCFWWVANVTANSAWQLFSPAFLMAGSRPKAAKWRIEGEVGKWMTFMRCGYSNCWRRWRVRMIHIIFPHWFQLINWSPYFLYGASKQRLPRKAPFPRGHSGSEKCHFFLRVLPGAWPCPLPQVTPEVKHSTEKPAVGRCGLRMS